MSKEVAEDYASSLADLTVNSKPLINMLTILAEENIDHAGVIVETVEKHLEKVHSDIKLPVLYLVDSIIKNVGGAYTQKFSQIIVNMFTRTFKQVDEKIRSQMFKLRETWHDVFPTTKLYQLDVKVNLIDPAWPIQAQPQQSNIHVNPNFLKKPVTPATGSVPATAEEDKMRSILAKKEQELIMLQRKKVEMELEQAKRQFEMAEKTTKKTAPAPTLPTTAAAMPIAMVNPVVAPPLQLPHEPVNLPVKQRLGPPVNKIQSSARIAPVSGALVNARRDPRLARRVPPAPAPSPAMPIASNVFDIKPLERVTKRKNVITIDVGPDAVNARSQPRRRDPRLEKRLDDRKKRDKEQKDREQERPKKEDKRDERKEDKKVEEDKNAVDSYLEYVPDAKKINKLPPIPKINRDATRVDAPPSTKRRKDNSRGDKKKKRDTSESGKDSSSSSSPEKKSKIKNRKLKPKNEMEGEEKQPDSEVVAFKELKNYHKERYMRRNREKSDSPIDTPEEKNQNPEAPKPAAESATSTADVATESKDVDLRVLQPVVAEKAAAVAQKRPSTETVEGKAKKNKFEKFDILFGNEDVDLRQLPQVEELVVPPPPSITESPKLKDTQASDNQPIEMETQDLVRNSPKKDWNEVKEREGSKKPSKLDLVRAKLAEATKGKDRLGRPLLFSKSPNAVAEKERRRTVSSEDTELRGEDSEAHKKGISMIMTQAKQEFSSGKMDINAYNTLIYQVLHLNEKMKLEEAKQKESFEVSKRKLKASIDENNHKDQISISSSPNERNNFGDVDERVIPSVFMDTPPDSQGFLQDSDMRMNMPKDALDGPKRPTLPPPSMPMFMNPNGPFPAMWRGQPRHRMDEFPIRRNRGLAPPFYRGKFEKRGGRPPFEPRMPQIPPLPTPKVGICQGEYPLSPYERINPPPSLGIPGFAIPPTDFRVLEYIDQDPVKTIQIDGIPREIIYYGETAVIMLEWDDPREIKFLPGSRRVTFDNKDSVVLSFNDGYKQVEIDDQTFDIRFGAPTRELYINGGWFECFFGGQPIGVLIGGVPRLIHLEGPLPQVDIGKVKRTDLCAGKINLIIDATHMFPIFLDAKVQKFRVEGNFYTIRFVDALRTVLINEVPFEVEFGGLPKPILIGNSKHFIRFSVLPRHVKPGFVHLANMEGQTITIPPVLVENSIVNHITETDQEEANRPVKTPSPDGVSQGLDMLASLMPNSTATPSASEYTSKPFFSKADKIPGLEAPKIEAEEQSNPAPSILGNINVSDLFAKLVATGIVKVDITNDTSKDEPAVEEVKKPREEKNLIHKVDLLKPETLRVKQPGLVSKLYGGMQCSGCGTRFPPEHTVRYSQHLDWHFRQNRRDRDSARRAHSRHWHYDLADWLQYEELEDLEEREKNWFETGGAEGEGESPADPGEEVSVAAGAPADQHCALCGDKFDQFYNEDKEEWHLRKAVRHDDRNYHPMCFEDYKASLTKEEPAVSIEEDTETVTSVENIEQSCEPIEIKDTDELNDQSDNESVVEVIETEENESEPLEIEEGDEDDVVFKAEPVEQVVVADEDTDDETCAERAERDRLAEMDFSKIKVKQEPIDPDDEPIITAEEEPVAPTVDMTQPTVLSSIDGNVQLEAAPAPATSVPFGGIRINISKTMPSSFVSNPPVDDKLEDISADEEPLPPGEEPAIEYKIKSSMEGVHFSKQPPVQKGSELSGLCSIM